MKKKFTIKNILNKILISSAACLLLAPISVQAASTAAEMVVYPGITVSPDGSGQAWTTDYGDRTDERLLNGYTIDMHAESSLRELQPGEHYYETEAVGSVSIGKWVVSHTPGQCIHDTITRDSFAGFTFSNEKCHAYYNNGWFAYCADCGEKVANMFLYGKSSTMEKITSMPASSIYVYICPYCDHLEQGYRYQHMCKAISYNRYQVTYRPNEPVDGEVEGFMLPTKHMYYNSDTYNGESASLTGYTDTALRKNCYSCEGYVFAGWNTKPDGSGIGYADGEEVLNLTAEDGGVVKLYAQWKKCESTLVLDAGGGTYKGEAVYEQKQKYGTSYIIDVGLIVPPKGYQVSFETNGGSEVGDITTTKHFSYWVEETDFAGTFQDNVYMFNGPDGTKDVLTARYGNDSFVLPNSVKENASLVGWYDSSELTEDSFVGKPDDNITIEKDTVLYAKWAALTLWAYDDYESHDGVGAVDLVWEQKDGQSKYYKLYQSLNQKEWSMIFTADDILEVRDITEHFGITEQGEQIIIEETGYYKLFAAGAKGADYNESLLGGSGGSVEAEYWLQKGDILTFYAGSSGVGTAGGENGSDAAGGDAVSDAGRGGGAATQIYLTRGANTELLLVAGGGGGANEGFSGGNGGELFSEPGNAKGEDSDYGGGGGGAVGGASSAAYTATTLEEPATEDVAFRSLITLNTPKATQVYDRWKGSKKINSAYPLLMITDEQWDTYTSTVTVGDLARRLTISSSNTEHPSDDEEYHYNNVKVYMPVVNKPPAWDCFQSRGGFVRNFTATYPTNGNTNVVVSGFIDSWSGTVEGYIQFQISDADTGELLHDVKYVDGICYAPEADAASWDILTWGDFDVSGCENVQVKVRIYQYGHETHTKSRVLDTFFYGRKIWSGSAAEGGSSYINTAYGCRNQSSNAGNNAGEGFAQLSSRDIGYHEETELKGVLAKDMAAPGLIMEYDTSISGEETYRVKFTDPVDYGTVYYHKAESFEEGSITHIATSNITENTLTSGIKGYRYYVDIDETGAVTENHAWTEVRTVNVILKDYVQYMHIAAVDVAGNIGPTLNIPVPKTEDTGDEKLDEDYFKAVPLMTEMLVLEDTEYVYASAPGTYFIKADGETEHTLFICGLLDGKATNRYQPDWLRLVSGTDITEWYQAKIPRLKIDVGDMNFVNEELLTDASIEELQYLVPTSLVAERTGQAARVEMEQMFTIDAVNDGKQIYVYPRAMAEYEEKEYWSDETADRSHGITLIPDAIAPVIDGIEALEAVGNIDMTEESKVFSITATDAGSGMRSLNVTITNLDNGMTRDYISDTGSLTITVAKDDYLFLGDFVVSALATDNVGNHTNEGSDKLAFTLKADLRRARQPHEGDFKAGDGAVLTVTAGGYADKVIIRFPDELISLKPNLNKEYVYEFPEAIKTEVYEFNLPLATPSGNYIIEVEAWKNGRKLTEELQQPVKASGSITEEFRTRIRDNGV